MRILSARARNIAVDRLNRQIQSTVILLLEYPDGRREERRVHTSAPISAPGGAPLRDRLIASAKLILMMSGAHCHPPEAELCDLQGTHRPAA